MSMVAGSHGGTSYATAHRRVREVKGDVRRYACIDCGVRSQHWSYDHMDPAELVDPKRACAYSLDPRRYRARCAKCHKAYDARFQVSRYARAHNPHDRMRDDR